jgi:hypothetical protein
MTLGKAPLMCGDRCIQDACRKAVVGVQMSGVACVTGHHGLDVFSR